MDKIKNKTILALEETMNQFYSNFDIRKGFLITTRNSELIKVKFNKFYYIKIKTAFV